MRIEIPANELRAMVKAAGEACATRTTRPVLECVKLEAAGDRLTASATDNEVGVRTSGAAVVRRPGECCTPAKRLAGVLAEIDGVVEVGADDTSVVVKLVGGKGRWTLPVEDPAEFPGVPGGVPGWEFTAPAEGVRAGLDQAEYACGKEDTNPRFATSALLVEAGEGAVAFVGTDTKRIGTAAVPAAVSGSGKDVLIPLKVVRAIRAAAGHGVGVDLTFTGGANEVVVAVGDTVVWGRLSAGKFPPWKQIVPKSCDHTFTCDPAAFGAAVKRAAVTADAEMRRVDFAFEAGKVTMRARGEGSGSSEVELELPGVDFTLDIAFDPVYLRETMTACLKAGCTQATVGLTNCEKPALFEWAGGKAVVMPMSSE